MMIQLLLLLLAPQQQIEQHFQRQQGQIEQIQQQLQQQQLQLGRLLLGIGSVDGALQQLQQQQLQLGRLLQMLQSSVCSAEIRWVNGSEQKIVPSNSATVVRLNLFSTISKPTDVCLPAEIRVTASYLDASDNLVCSGAIENLAIQNTLTLRRALRHSHRPGAWARCWSEKAHSSNGKTPSDPMVGFRD